MSRYEHLPGLPNATADAAGVAAALRETGYRTVVLTPASRHDLLHQLARLRLAAADAAQVVVYYSGHGLQSGGESFILLPGVRPSVGRWRQQSVPLSLVAQVFADKPRQKIILFDACRTVPDLDGVSGFSGPEAALPAGVLLAYAAQPGAPAWDGGGRNSPFAAALIAGLARRPATFGPLLRETRVRVVMETGGLQVPWQRSALLREARLPLMEPLAQAVPAPAE